MPLTPKQDLFVREYLMDLNATQAALRAGYSARTAESQGSRLLRNVEVAAAVSAAKGERRERIAVDADRVLQELVAIALADPRALYDADGNLKPLHELTDAQAAALASVDSFEVFEGRGEARALAGHRRKVKCWQKVEALRLLMQHLGMLVERHEHTGANGGPIEVAHGLTEEERAVRVVALLDRGRARRAGLVPGSAAE